MFAIYLAGLILLANFPDIGGQTTSSGIDIRMVNSEQVDRVNKCNAECGGEEAYEESERNGEFACFTIEENPKYGIPRLQEADSPCHRLCMGGRKPDDDQLKCFFEMCSAWKTKPKNYNYIFFAQPMVRNTLIKMNAISFSPGKCAIMAIAPMLEWNRDEVLIQQYSGLKKNKLIL